VARDFIELAALFVAVAVAEVFAKTVGHAERGPVVLIGLGVGLVACSAIHRWWAHRHSQPPAPRHRDGTSLAELRAAGGTLWRMRTTLADTPGRLAAISNALAARGVNILSIQVHPLPDAVVDELLVVAPPGLTPDDLERAINRAGAGKSHIEVADAHDLVDVPTWMLGLVERATNRALLPGVLRELLGDCQITRAPMATPGVGDDKNTIQIDDLVISRPGLEFTPTETARAAALVALGARLAPRRRPVALGP
jgi:hypothetical protein